MRIRRVKSRGLVLSRLPAAQLRLLQQIPVHADPAGSATAEERLYQSPVRTPLDDAEDELIDDWNDHILPELRSEFATQLDRVADDLRQARREPPRKKNSSLRESIEADEEDLDDDDEDPPVGETYEITIPPAHIESWYGALNQARLVMQARYNFPEVESLASIVALLASENLKPYLTSRFYTEIQAALLDLGMDTD